MLSLRTLTTYCEFDARAVHSTLPTRWVEDARRCGRTDTYLGKRQHPRWTWSVDLLVRVDDGPMMDQTLPARAVNVSLGGVGMIVRAPLRAGVGVTIRVTSETEAVSGTVVHCTKIMQGYLVGLSFASPSDFGLPPCRVEASPPVASA